jgi:hypothetical protein
MANSDSGSDISHFDAFLSEEEYDDQPGESRDTAIPVSSDDDLSRDSPG